MTSRRTPCRHAGTRPPGSRRAHDLDAASYPENPCTPTSDANAPGPSCIGVSPWCLQANAGGGAAFTGLQFYPPGEAPLVDSISCDNAHWCAALTTGRTDCTLNFATGNPSCTEPVHFGLSRPTAWPPARTCGTLPACAATRRGHAGRDGPAAHPDSPATVVVSTARQAHGRLRPTQREASPAQHPRKLHHGRVAAFWAAPESQGGRARAGGRIGRMVAVRFRRLESFVRRRPGRAARRTRARPGQLFSGSL
jgi:hypothetical protein